MLRFNSSRVRESASPSRQIATTRGRVRRVASRRRRERRRPSVHNTICGGAFGIAQTDKAARVSQCWTGQVLWGVKPLSEWVAHRRHFPRKSSVRWHPEPAFRRSLAGSPAARSPSSSFRRSRAAWLRRRFAVMRCARSVSARSRAPRRPKAQAPEPGNPPRFMLSVNRSAVMVSHPSTFGLAHRAEVHEQLTESRRRVYLCRVCGALVTWRRGILGQPEPSLRIPLRQRR